MCVFRTDLHIPKIIEPPTQKHTHIYIYVQSRPGQKIVIRFPSCRKSEIPLVVKSQPVTKTSDRSALKQIYTDRSSKCIMCEKCVGTIYEGLTFTPTACSNALSRAEARMHPNIRQNAAMYAFFFIQSTKIRF